MELRLLGHAGLTFSVLTLGTLTWGRDTDAEESASLLGTFVDAGGSSLDVPTDWDCPTFAGRLATVRDLLEGPFADHRFTLTLRSGALPKPDGPAPTRPVHGPLTSRKHLLESLDYSLDSLGRDSVDLWVIHGPLQRVPLDEVLSAAALAYTSGRANYVGLSGFSDWDLGAATQAGLTDRVGLSALATPLSLLESAPLLSAVPHAAAAGLGILAHSPLAQGVLTGKYMHSTPPDSRAASRHLGALTAPYFGAQQGRVVEATVRAGAELDKHAAQIALAWVLSQPGITSTVVGPRTARQLETLLDGFPVRLPRELRDVLTEVAVR